MVAAWRFRDLASRAPVASSAPSSGDRRIFIPPVGLLLGAAVGGALGDLVAPPKTPTIDGPRLSDLSVQTSTYGAPIRGVWHHHIVRQRDLVGKTNRLTENPKIRWGKGGGGGAKTRTYTYSATFAVALCRGPIVGVRRPGWVRIWSTTLEPPITRRSAPAIRRPACSTLYPGSDTQEPDPRIQATLGVDHTPAWRGLAYLVIADLPLAKYSNSLLGAQVKAEVVTAGTVTDYGVIAQTAPMAQGAGSSGTATASSRPSSTGKNLDFETGETGTWTLRYDDAAAGEFRLATNGEICVLTRFASPFVLTSYDGVTWVPRVVPDWFGVSQLVDVVAGGRGFLASADCTSGVQWFALSPDGITWYPAGRASFRVWFLSALERLRLRGAQWRRRQRIWTSPSGLEGTWTSPTPARRSITVPPCSTDASSWVATTPAR